MGVVSCTDTLIGSAPHSCVWLAVALRRLYTPSSSDSYNTGSLYTKRLAHGTSSLLATALLTALGM